MRHLELRHAHPDRESEIAFKRDKGDLDRPLTTLTTEQAEPSDVWAAFLCITRTVGAVIVAISDFTKNSMLRELHHFPKAKMSLRKMFGKTMLCAMLGASLLAGVPTPAHADRDAKCRRDIRKAEEKLENAVRKHGEGSLQAEQRSRRQQFVVPAITYQRRIV